MLKMKFWLMNKLLTFFPSGIPVQIVCGQICSMLLSGMKTLKMMSVVGGGMKMVEFLCV
jgi:hypothetical protein